MRSRPALACFTYRMKSQSLRKKIEMPIFTMIRNGSFTVLLGQCAVTGHKYEISADAESVEKINAGDIPEMHEDFVSLICTGHTIAEREARDDH